MSTSHIGGDNPPLARLTIGEFSKLCRLTVVALRHYDRVGLLRPAEVDPSTGYRYYRLDQVGAALQIGLLRSLDVSIADLRRLAEGSSTLDDLLAAQRSQLTAQIHEREKMVAVIDALAHGVNVQPYEIVRGVEPETRVVGLSVDTSWDRIESATRHALARLAVSLRRAGVRHEASSGALFPISPDERVTVTVFAAVDEFAGRALPSIQLPNVDAISAIHRGDQRLLGYAYHALLAHVRASGLEAFGQAREHYVTTASTRVVIPVSGATT
jgi:DNA-binding transcriptional MerR regulator